MTVPGEDAMGGITHHANGRQQPFSDSTTRRFRGKTVALVDTGVVGTRPVPFGRQHAVTAGGIPRGRGRSTPSGTGILSPNAQGVPDRERMHPHVQKVPVEIDRPRPAPVQRRPVPGQHQPSPDPTPGSVPDQRPSGAQAGARSTTMRSESLPTSGSRVRGASRGW